MACETKGTFSWSENTEKCTLTKVMLDTSGKPITTISMDDSIDPDECCQAGMDDLTDHVTMLKACIQTYTWEHESEQCALISTKRSDGRQVLDEGLEAADCC